MDVSFSNESDAVAGDDDSSDSSLVATREAVSLLESVVAPAAATMGFELVHLEWAATARPRVVRLFVDHPNGVTLDDCARLSPIISNVLDAAEHAESPDAAALRALLESSYVLEVSSPGVERPLSRRGHFDRYVGAQVTVRTNAPVHAGSPQKTFHGQIVATKAGVDPANERDGIVVIADDAGVAHEIPLTLIRRAHLVVSPPQASNRRSKPGGRRTGSRPESARSAQQKIGHRG